MSGVTDTQAYVTESVCVLHDCKLQAACVCPYDGAQKLAAHEQYNTALFQQSCTAYAVLAESLRCSLSYIECNCSCISPCTTIVRMASCLIATGRYIVLLSHSAFHCLAAPEYIPI